MNTIIKLKKETEMKVTEKNGTAEYKNGRIYIELTDGRKYRSSQVSKDHVNSEELEAVLWDLEFGEDLYYSIYDFREIV